MTTLVSSCLLHNVVRFGYIECIENDLQLMVRALLLCRESMSSKNQLVEKFNLTTVVIARIAETCRYLLAIAPFAYSACSSVAAQKTTTEQTANVLNGHFDNLNDLNELLVPLPACKRNNYSPFKQRRITSTSIWLQTMTWSKSPTTRLSKPSASSS